MLGIEPVDMDKEDCLPNCNLFAIHSSWENSNELSQMFLFWVLCREQDFVNKDDRHKLWKTIVCNISEWLEILPSEIRLDFKPGRSERHFQYKGGKTVSISEHGEKILKYCDITQEQIDGYKTHILILNTDIAKLIPTYRLSNATVHLTNKSYWIYGIEGLNKVTTRVTDNTNLKQKVTNMSEQAEQHQSPYNLSYYGNMKEKYGKTFTASKSNQRTDNDKTKLNPENDISFARPRQFKQDGSTDVYFQGWVIDQPECGSRMITPSLEFKFFRSSLDTDDGISPMKKFLKETLRFACGCLNRRRNGTIYFGIADDHPVGGRKYRHGEVVGFPIMEVDNITKNRYTDELNTAKSNYFDSPEAKEAAKECIKDPVFVKVSPSSPELPLYVMEVDIEPKSHHCKGIKFKVNLSKVLDKKLKSTLYIRDGSETKALNAEHEELRFVAKLNDYDADRKQEEDAAASYMSFVADHKYMADKLVRKLCKGGTQFDPTLWPILISSKPADHGRKDIYSSLSFISNIHWTAVFEFDDDSWSKGLCKHFFNPAKITLTDGEIFRDVENNTELRHNLRLPEKCVFIYCNGRTDERKPHLLKHSWKKMYAPNVKGAINFFQQKSVAPMGRAVVIFLLFSTDFEGFIDVFGEITTFFGNGQVVLICADQYVYGHFKQAVLLQDILPEEELDSNCVVGMPWQQTDECIKRVLGVDNPTVTSIPSSSGTAVVVEPNVEGSLDCVEILSCTQCENKTFETHEAKRHFSREKELRFYQGNRVEWWNFYFNGHVMERHCFRNLKRKIHSALTERNPNHTRAVPIFLIHEPGAGGSTLAKHVLWEFRKDFRCGIITKLKEKTATDILSFWRYKEDDRNAEPVLLLIDSVPEQKIDPDELPHLIAKQQLDYPVKLPLCVLLICMRDESVNMPLRRPQLSVTASEFLSQEVEKKEGLWLKQKIEELETTSRDLGLTEFRGEYFITFMILHSNFNKIFLLDTVKNLLKGISFEEKQFKLLMYVALVVAYVSPSKCGAAIAIPVECCSELMGQNLRIRDSVKEHKTNLWENELHGNLKILLVTEPKENGSGKQIRMAHPNLAKTVIECIKTRRELGSTNQVALAEIALDFLESDILQTCSYAKTFVTRLSVEMLIRRKKEEYDDGETTNFSPLIESILQESSSSEPLEPAAKVLRKGFEIMKDGFIAHQLARLYLDKRVYAAAKTWAKEAVGLSPKRSSFIHTLGNVCKLTFLGLSIWDSEDKYKPNDPVVKEALDIGLEAFEIFKEASACDQFEINLLACYDVISTANCIAKFIYQYVDMGNKSMIHRYFTDEDFSPQSLTGWERYHDKLKSLYSRALVEVDVLDEHIYYSRRTYASKFSQEQEEHRNSRTIKRKLPDTLEDFVKFFGEQSDSDQPPSYIKSDLMKDAWYRRSVVSLHGKRLVDVFRVVQAAYSRDEQERITPTLAIERLMKVQTHLSNIQDKSSDDYLNIVSVNLALAQLKAPRQIGMKELFDYCSTIVHSRRRGNTLNMAYLYIMMFLWPRKKKHEVQYNHDLMIRSMKHLFEEFRTTKQRKTKVENDLFKRENNVFHSVVLFYAAKGRGLSSFCHNTQLPGKRQQQQDMKEQFWESPHIQEKLRLLNGHTRILPNGNTVSVVVDLREFDIDEEIEIRNLRCGHVDITERPVSFFLGFSLSGPVVCYIRPKDPSLVGAQSMVGALDYDDMSVNQLENLKRRIATLKNKKDLNEREKMLIRDERLIDNILKQIHFEEGILE